MQDRLDLAAAALRPGFYMMGEPQASPAHADLSVPPPARWRAPLSGSFEAQGSGVAPLIAAADFTPIAPDLDVWDAWPIQHADGQPVDIGGGATLWMALGAPHFADPDLRHGHARIHLLQWRGGQWTNLGPAMPDGFSPGSREWSGSAVLTGAEMLTLFFTATGRRGELVQSFEQRLFRARANLSLENLPHLTDWRDLAEVVACDPRFYMSGDHGTGMIGTIKAFRDPAYFLDPQDGSSHLLFAGSAANSQSPYNGVIGLASATDATLDKWETLPPIVSADGLNNELERPHAIVHAGMYYLFWSTQQHVFDPAGPTGPTGLYGMVADGLRGNWQPLNGTGLVFRNPASAPAQAYSWLVMPDLRVTSFVDDWASNPAGAPDKPQRNFGAAFAPMLVIELDGNEARLVPGDPGHAA